MFISLKHLSLSQRWFIAAALLCMLFIVYTIIFSTGVFTYPTLYVEQWLLHRPLNRFDCVLHEWKQLGEVGASLFFTLLLAIACLFLKYRYRMLPYLFLLLLLGVGIEYLGKQYFPQPVPHDLRLGLNSLDCPQVVNESRSTKLLVGLGMWWQALPVRPGRVSREQYSASVPIVINEETPYFYSYPSGHAMRWCFLGLIACWLLWRHIRYRLLRAILMIVALIIAFGGGFSLFYAGLHLPTDLIGGYLIGSALACCAIGLLARSARKDTIAKQAPPVVQPTADAVAL